MPRRPVPPTLSALELLASLAAVIVVVLMPLQFIGAHLCAWGECSVPGAEEIRTYRLMVLVLVVAVTTTLTLSVRRRAHVAVAGHAVVGLVGLAVALVFAMPTIDWADLRREEPPAPNPDYVPCYSGSGDCVGG
ncbi:DUF6234 family protein [Pimelobacter sp. 30-1]|uniref:DUF6234 family protein n=1 Tax=Pimelobacter sp. 30-1 TaxID=2004991 RepID=UPI001C04790A|nr:DUF6234 family protein [Pimelobacter sp. 30-1]MBU2696277.1 hypothetical protein [Pimelobacter sp. 30-1]